MSEAHRRTVESGYNRQEVSFVRYAGPRTGPGSGNESETWLWVLAHKGLSL